LFLLVCVSREAPSKKAPQHPTPKPRERCPWNGGKHDSQEFETEHYRRTRRRDGADVRRTPPAVVPKDKAQGELAGKGSVATWCLIARRSASDDWCDPRKRRYGVTRYQVIWGAVGASVNT
jgi:hypothetical protein